MAETIEESCLNCALYVNENEGYQKEKKQLEIELQNLNKEVNHWKCQIKDLEENYWINHLQWKDLKTMKTYSGFTLEYQFTKLLI